MGKNVPVESTQGKGRGPRKPPRRVEVARVETLSPYMKRITVTGESLVDWPEGDPSGHCKVFLPSEGEAEPTLPEMGPEGLVFPDGRPRPVVRTYTPRRINRGIQELDIDFVLHGHGVASRWAENVETGMKLAVAGVGRGYAIDTEATSFYLAGDESAIPAISVILEALPVTAQVTVDFEIRDHEAKIHLPEHPGATSNWMVNPWADKPGQALINSLANIDPTSGVRVWVATEAQAVRGIRRNLLGRGMPADHLVTRGYWKLGASNHPDGDYATDA